MSSGRTIVGAVLRTSGVTRPYVSANPLRLETLHLDAPLASEVLIQVEAAGVCHSDLSVVNGHRPRPLPMLLGHEGAGTVVALGPDVSDLRVGQRVVMTFLPRCESCEGCSTGGRLPCTNGSVSNAAGEMLSGGSRLSAGVERVHHHLGVSCFANYAVVDRRSLVPVGPDVPPGVAALLGCAVLTGGGAVLNAGQLSDGQDLAVVGLGGVGMAALMVARAVGCARIVGVDPSPAKQQLALELGADYALDPGVALESTMRSAVVLDASGVARGLETAFELTSVGGRTVTAGLPSAADLACLSPLRITSEARTVIGSYLGSSVPSRDIPKYEAMWRGGTLPLERLITREIPLDEVNSAMDLLSEGAVLRQVVVP